MYCKNIYKFLGLIVLLSLFSNFSVSETITKSYSFNDKNLIISLDKGNKGNLISIYGLDENLSKYGEIKKSNIGNICNKFFKEYSEVLGIDNGDLRIIRLRLHKGKYYVHYKQYYKDIPVYKSYLSLVIDQNNKINKMIGNLYRNIDLDINTYITSQNSEIIAVEHYSTINEINSDIIKSDSTKLLILPKETTNGCNYILVYRVVLDNRENFNSNNEYFIDAHTSKIINIGSTWRKATLSGSLRLPYYEDYNSSVNYINCANTDFVINNYLGQEITSGTTNSSGTFSISFSAAVAQYYFDANISDTDFNQWCYTNLDDNYLDVQGTFNWYGSSKSIYPYFYENTFGLDDDNLPCNVYYHVNKMHDYFTSSPFNFTDMNYKMYANIQIDPYVNGSSNGISIGFGEEDDISWAKSPDCIYHEYSHCVVYHIYDNDWIGNHSNNQPSAMDEGFADYFDCAYRNDHIHCEGLGEAESDLSNNYIYSYTEDYDWNGQVIGGACWDVRSTVTAINVDLLVFNTLLQNPHSFSQFLDCMLEEDDDPLFGGNNNILNGTPHDNQICNAFINNHKIVGSYLAGDISTNITIDHDVYIIDNVNVTSGATLTIEDGVTIFFGGYYTLSVQSGSKIIAEGTVANPILFTSATGSSPGSWKYISLYGGNNVFKYCEFRYGYRPLYLYYCNSDEGSRNLIENCTIHHNSSYGIYLHHSLANIKVCNVHNDFHGIYCRYSSDVKLTGNSIYNNSYDGVQSADNNFLEFYGNVIKQNGRYGIYTMSADHLHIGEPYDFYGYNTIWDNGSTEVYAGSGNTHVEANYSCIYDNSGLEMYNYSGNQSIYTQNCFWGSECNHQTSGPITFDNPGCLPGWEGNTFTGGPLGKNNFNSGNGLIAESSDGAIIDLSLSDEEKIEQCKEIIANSPKSEDAREALILLYSILRADYVDNALNERSDFYAYLNDLYSNYTDATIGKLALRYMIYWKMLGCDDESVINLCSAALKLFSDEDQKDVYADLIVTYIHGAELDQAKSILSELKEKYTDDELIDFLEENIAEVEWQIAEGIWEQDDNGETSPPPEDQPVTSAPDEFSFSANYPNPFNPITTITFILPEASKVKTEVYDLTGRCVAVLCDRHYSAGIYSVQFDGSALASGIYFLRSRMISIEKPGKSRIFTHKTMLMK